MSTVAKVLCCTLVACLFAVPAVAADEPLSLAAALRRAVEHHPRIRALEAERERLRGQRAAARQWLPDNPELGGDWTSRDGADDATTDWEVSLSQRFEVAGQRGHRLDGVSRRHDALEAELGALRVEVIAEVRHAYTALSVAQRREQVAAEMVSLNDRLVQIARARFTAGDVAEAQRRRLKEERSAAAARRELAVALGLEHLPAVPPSALAAPTAPPPLVELEPLLVRHPRQSALVRAQQAVTADLALARAARLPDITVSAHAGEEGSRDTLVGVGLSLPLPLLHRQQAEIATAHAARARLSAEEEQTRSELRQEMVRAHTALVAALEELALFDSEILPGLDTHLRRIHRAYQLGEMDLTTLTVTQAQVMAARFDHLQALADAWQARIDLDRALGVDPLATNAGDTAEPMRNHR